MGPRIEIDVHHPESYRVEIPAGAAKQAAGAWADELAGGGTAVATMSDQEDTVEDIYLELEDGRRIEIESFEWAVSFTPGEDDAVYKFSCR